MSDPLDLDLGLSVSFGKLKKGESPIAVTCLLLPAGSPVCYRHLDTADPEPHSKLFEPCEPFMPLWFAIRPCEHCNRALA